MFFKKCEHVWEKQTDTIMRANYKINSRGYELEDLLKDFETLRQKHIVILSCKKCGEIYKSVEQGPI